MFNAQMFCDKARAASCQQHSPQPEEMPLVTDGKVTIVAADLTKITLVNFGQQTWW